MKEPKWDELETLKDYLEASTVVAPEAEAPAANANASAKMRMTELRRRIEERLDRKRIALECDYLMFDEAVEGNLQ